MKTLLNGLFLVASKAETLSIWGFYKPKLKK